MTGVDIVIVVLGVLTAGLGAVQLATGRKWLGWVPRRRHLTPGFFRAYGALYGFVGLLIIWTVAEKSLSPTAITVSSAFLSMGVIVSATWAFILAVRKRPLR